MSLILTSLLELFITGKSFIGARTVLSVDIKVPEYVRSITLSLIIGSSNSIITVVESLASTAILLIEKAVLLPSSVIVKPKV